MYIRASIRNIWEEDYELQYMEAWSDDTLPRVLTDLAKSPYADVREGVALNPNTPDETLISLINDTHLRVRNAVRRNKNVPTVLRDIDTDEWWYSDRFEYIFQIYYPDANIPEASCDEVIESAVREFVNDYGDFKYEEGRFYTVPGKDRRTFRFECEYTDYDRPLSDAVKAAEWLEQDIATYITDDVTIGGYEFCIYSGSHIHLLGE